jgi:hypothetical protein
MSNVSVRNHPFAVTDLVFHCGNHGRMAALHRARHPLIILMDRCVVEDLTELMVTEMAEARRLQDHKLHSWARVIRAKTILGSVSCCPVAVKVSQTHDLCAVGYSVSPFNPDLGGAHALLLHRITRHVAGLPGVFYMAGRSSQHESPPPA